MPVSPSATQKPHPKSRARSSALGRMGRKFALIGSLMSMSMSFDADAAITSNETVPMDVYDHLPSKVSDGYIPPYTAEHLHEVVTMVREPSPYDASFLEAEEMYGVPAATLKLYTAAESNMDANAQSPTGPLGICQFAKGTAIWTSMVVDHENGQDDRLNPHKSIMAMGMLMAYYLGQTNGRFFSENGKWGVFQYLHGDTPDNAHWQYEANLKAAAEVLGLPQRISGFAKVKGGSAEPLSLVAAANGMTPIEMTRHTKRSKKNVDDVSVEQNKKPNVFSRMYKSMLAERQKRADDQEKIEHLQHTLDSLEQVNLAIAAQDRPLVHKQPVTCLEERVEKQASMMSLDGAAGGPPDDEPDSLQEHKDDAFTDQEKADLANTLMGKKVRIGDVVFDMTEAYADNSADISKPVPRDLAMLLGVFAKAYGTDKAASYLRDTLKTSSDDSETLSVDDGSVMADHVREYAEYIAHCLEINKTIFSDTPIEQDVKPQRSLPAPQHV